MNFFRKKEHKDIEVNGIHSVSAFRSAQNNNLLKVINNLPHIKNVLNLGAVQGDSDKEGKLYKDYFLKKEYFTLDKFRNDSSQNHFNLDMEEMDMAHVKFDLILFMSVLEHLKNPKKVIDKLKFALNPGGYIYVTSPFMYPLHKAKDSGYTDYWRFTDDGLRELFYEYSEEWILEVKSVINEVNDRPRHWSHSKTPTGYCALFSYP